MRLRTPLYATVALSLLTACGSEEVSSPEDNPPAVTLVAPNGGDFAPSQQVSWLARDPDDDDILTIDLELMTLDGAGEVVATETIATDLENVVGTEAATFDWNRDGVALVDGEGQPVPYKIRVTATDLAGQSVSDESDEPFTLLDDGALENLVWDDVKPIFGRYCVSCHGEPAIFGGIEFFRLDKYDMDDPEPPTNADRGVFEMLSAIETRMIDQGNMPPFGSDLPSDLDKMRVESWLLDGAPLTR